MHEFTASAVCVAAAAQAALPGVGPNPVVTVIEVPAANFPRVPFSGPRAVKPAFNRIGFGTEIEFVEPPVVSTRGIILKKVQ